MANDVSLLEIEVKLKDEDSHENLIYPVKTALREQYNLAGLDMAQTENKCIEFSIQIMDISSLCGCEMFSPPSPDNYVSDFLLEKHTTYTYDDYSSELPKSVKLTQRKYLNLATNYM
ncbi:hypothetical protein Bpfe_013564 [Biomphalaria pfeifferi]|uniref:Uncharacterized protein n=1 Tax=Biomphalaria pfeifferi TaxID=112525 RepID=A0AAD8F9P7_BIOPF|nr:hypothetical protein Bpfe_013564 [Biomphalaria pfeifferi]